MNRFSLIPIILSVQLEYLKSYNSEQSSDMGDISYKRIIVVKYEST